MKTWDSPNHRTAAWLLLSLLCALGAPPAPGATADPLEPVRSAVRLKQFDKALTELRKQAAGGNVDAQYLLGLALYNGLTQEPDPAEARSWLARAADAHHAGAAFALAAILSRGDSADEAQARQWLARAAQEGNTMAQAAVKADRSPLEPERKLALQDAGMRVALFLWSARANDAALMRSLLKGASVEAADDFGSTALSLAAGAGAADTLALLLEAHANPNAANRFGVTPLMVAATQPKVEITAALLGHGAKPDAADKVGNTALMHAARANQAVQVQALVKAGVPIAAQNAQKWSALDLALKSGSNEAAASLRALGARPALSEELLAAHGAKDADYTRGGALYRGWPQMLIAASRDDVVAVERLLDAGESARQFTGR